jgi:DNA-binding NarL/FixJ family response regulator
VTSKIEHLPDLRTARLPDTAGRLLLYVKAGPEATGFGRIKGKEQSAMRILLADDQPGVRFALKSLLERQPGLELTGEATCAADCLVQAQASSADLVLLDWELPGLSTGLLQALRQACPDLSIIAMSGWPEAGPAALAAGMDAFVSKAEPAEQLLAAIAKVAAHSPRRNS